MHLKIYFQTLLIFLLFVNCSKQKNTTGTPSPPTPPPVSVSNDVDLWMTKGDFSALLQKQTSTISFNASANSNNIIEVDTSTSFQTMVGFGYTLTGGSAVLINQLNASVKASLLNELFGKETNSIGISYLRISIGASDLDSVVFSYNDLGPGEIDINLEKFSLAPDRANLIPLLKEILAINPSIKILGSPWSPPTWMKDNNNSKGGSLLPQFYSVYANYFVKYIQQMKDEGITIDAITPQNEPLHPGNNPSMFMTAAQQAEFIKNHLGPAFQSKGIGTKIIIYDHNADRPDYPIEILNDAAAKQYIDGSAFHLYGGDISALSQVRNAHPDKHIYFTEQYTAADGNFEGDLEWHIKNLIIGAPRNWSRNVLEWNLANDPNFKPHTPGGCNTCKGALTIGNNSVTRNVSYYIIAHASKFVPHGSIRIASNIPGSLHNVAFKTPEGKKVLIVLNEGNTNISFNIKFNNRFASTSLPASSVGTFVW
jgi:glucosylceramidase